MPIGADGGVVENIELGRIRRPAYPLRLDLGPLNDLMSSIMDRGLIQPVVVRPLSDGFELVAGNRRYEACKRLGIRKLPCHILQLDDRQAFEVSLIENIQHRTMNPLEEAQAFHEYVTKFGYGASTELAQRIGKSSTYVSRRLSLLSSKSNGVGRLLRQRKIPVTVANELLSLDAETRDELIAGIEKDKMTRREIRQVVKEKKMEDGGFDSIRVQDPEEAHLRSIERALDRCAISMRVCMNRFDDVLEYLEDDWLAKQTIVYFRGAMHEQIDEILKLKRRTIRYQHAILTD